MSLAAIVPVWNGRPLLERLLASLAQQTLPADELLVVDNGSTDGAPEAARACGARVIEMGRNAGFAAAVNRGIREARAGWIAVLNSDVELAPDYFALLTASREWFATGKILAASAPELIDGAFDLVCRGGTAWRGGNGCADGPAWAARRRIWSAPWTAAVFRAELFEKTGLLEERFESYLEDVEFGLRCAGLGLAGEYVRHMSRNPVWLLARHYSRPDLLGCWWPAAVAQLLWGAVALRHGAGFAWLKGKLQGLSGFAEIRQKRENPHLSLREHLLANESLIQEIQSTSGPDNYWRLYFLLTTREAK
jgi:glycosyltransferase involved in cell wall biosynthesis